IPESRLLSAKKAEPHILRPLHRMIWLRPLQAQALSYTEIKVFTCFLHILFIVVRSFLLSARQKNFYARANPFSLLFTAADGTVHQRIVVGHHQMEGIKIPERFHSLPLHG